MPGTVLSAGIVAAAALVSIGLAAGAGAAVGGQRLAGAADAAALAAADAASGSVPGVPCERAAQVASANDVDVIACELDGLVATVTVGTRFAGFVASASARAGPPP